MYRRIFFFVLFLLFVAAAATWASEGGTEEIKLESLENSLQRVMDFFTSQTMKIIFSIGLGGLLIAFGLNRENPELKKRFLFWIIAVGGLLGLSQITDTFFNTETSLLLLP